MRISTSMRWLVVVAGAAMLLAVAAACSSETIEVPGETVVVEKEVVKTVEVPGETVVKEVIKEVQVPGETVVVKEEVVKEVMVPGETVVVEKVVTETVEVPGQTVTVEVVKTVEVPGETVVVEKEVVKTVEVPGQTVVVEKEVVKTVEVPGETVVVEKEVVKTVEVPGPERVMVKEVPMGYVTDPSTGKAVSAPQYGGTLTFTYRDYAHTDNYVSLAAMWWISPVLEKLGMADWAIDRDTYPFIGSPITPLFAIRGAVAESWEQPDPLTYVFNIRKGVRWHDKAPMNGRELTAKDVEYTFHRMLGSNLTGTEFSEAEPSTGATLIVGAFPGIHAGLPLESVTATDKWTVVMKLKEPRPGALPFFLDYGGLAIQPPEVIEQYGDMKDWRNLVGTGPYMITDWVEGSSITFTKNPDYWGHDEKYPENRLPYIDKLEALVIPEVPTRLAGLRTATIDLLGVPMTQLRGVDQALSLQKTNPDLVLVPYMERSDQAVLINVAKPPFDDIRVRHAMQMGLDLETTNLTYYKGHADTIPRGMIGRAQKGWYVPFEEWSPELKGYYTYDVAGAEKLLDEAGYPRGADGIRFKTTYSHRDRHDLGFTELLAAYWREIGVVVDIQVITAAEWSADMKSGDFELISFSSGSEHTPQGHGENFWSGHPWSEAWRPVDAQYDALYEARKAATTLEEKMIPGKAMDIYAIEQHWMLWGPVDPQFIVHQPWVKGYNGEFAMGHLQALTVLARLWIDSELKKAMGH